MPASSAAPTTAANGLASSLVTQLENASTVMLANNWVTKPQLENIKIRVFNTAEPVPSAGRSLLAQFLLDNRLMPREQVADLDSIIKTQATLPEFQLQKKIGAGGMGTVFLALHLETQRQVALKTINARLADDKDFVERFHREARALEQVRNLHIAEIIACGETEGTCWLAMEYIHGPSLMSLLKEHRVLPEYYALNLIRQIAEGLGHVWDKAGLVHRDIKPENVLVVRNRLGDELFPSTDVAKLIDFGLVKSNSDDDRLTQTGMTIGTPLYMSPEQVRGEKLDCRSDIYGVGATMYHLLTGHTPFNGNSPGAIMSAHLTEAVPDPGDRVPSLSRITRQIVLTAMAKNVEKRFLSFEALISMCEEALAGLEHKSTSIPRLLRKPMVLKNPIKRSGEIIIDESMPSQPGATPASPNTGSVLRPKTDRMNIVRPAKPDRNAATVVTPPREPTTSFKVPPPAARPGGTQASTRAPVASGGTQASKQTSNQASKPLRAALSTSSGELLPPTQSAAFVEPTPSPGTGLLPWLVLGFAVLAMGAFLAVSYL